MIYGCWREQIWTCSQRCWLPFLSGSLFGNMIKVITLDWSCAFFCPPVPPLSTPSLPSAKTLAHGHASPCFFFYLSLQKIAPHSIHHRTRLLSKLQQSLLGIEQSPMRSFKPDVIQGGISPDRESSLISDLGHICTLTYLLPLASSALDFFPRAVSGVWTGWYHQVTRSFQSKDSWQTLTRR